MLAACGGEHLSAKLKWHTQVVSTGRSDGMGARTDYRAVLCQEHSFGQGHGGLSECIQDCARHRTDILAGGGSAQYGTRLRDFREFDRILLRRPGPGINLGHGRSRFMKGKRRRSQFTRFRSLQNGTEQTLAQGCTEVSLSVSLSLW